MSKTNIKIGLKEILLSEGDLPLKLMKLLDYFLGGLIARMLPAKNTLEAPPFPIKSILVLRPGGIGDAAFLTVVLKNFKQSSPGINIDVLCEKRNYEVFSLEGRIVRHVFCYEDVRSFFKIFKNKYDVVIDTEQWHYLSSIAAYFIKAYAIGFATRPLKIKLFNKAVEYELNEYELTNFQRLFEGLFDNIKNLKSINNTLTLDFEECAHLKESLPEKPVVLFLGGSIKPRRFTNTQADEIVGILLEGGNQVVLIGGKSEIVKGSFLELKHKNSALYNFTGKTTLKESAVIIKLAKKFITHDSGLMHIAIMLGTPVIALCGPGNQEKWIGKEGCAQIISLNMPCSPCTKFGYTIPSACLRKYSCVSDIRELVKAVALEKGSEPRH
ncbi:MAG: glycosyltransferase family 9 protein [Candidatus Omnitrophica bacterium]|nr:glycosyltransferase family 9 protein [Candidatus Omnitrophota bacterium]